MKHNVFLGSGSGSIGDVVSYRREGTQVSRMRVREIKNPRTYSQAEQRNFLAPVSKFYAPLAAALEQSFEGKSTAKSYAAFSSEAVKKARLNGWYLPKGTGFFPLPYKLSHGTIAPLPQVLDPAGGNPQLQINITIVSEGADPITTVGGIVPSFVAAGYKEGDQITVITVKRSADGSYVPAYKRFFLDAESTETLASAFGQNVSAAVPGDSNLIVELAAGHVAAAVIVSRYENEKWRRSTQALMVDTDTLELVTGETAKENAIASYMDGEYVPVSEIYLNGSTQQ